MFSYYRCLPIMATVYNCWQPNITKFYFFFRKCLSLTTITKQTILFFFLQTIDQNHLNVRFFGHKKSNFKDQNNLTLCVLWSERHKTWTDDHDGPEEWEKIQHDLTFQLKQKNFKSEKTIIKKPMLWLHDQFTNIACNQTYQLHSLRLLKIYFQLSNRLCTFLHWTCTNTVNTTKRLTSVFSVVHCINQTTSCTSFHFNTMLWIHIHLPMYPSKISWLGNHKQTDLRMSTSIYLELAQRFAITLWITVNILKMSTKSGITELTFVFN